MRDADNLDTAPAPANGGSPARERLLSLLMATDRRRRQAGHVIVPRNISGPVPLSYAQERLWFLDQLGLEKAYNMPMALRLEGELDIRALDRSLAELVRRHESLRTRFQSVSGDAVQVIDAPEAFSLQHLDLSGMGEATRAREVQRLSNEEARRPFDLSTGPVFRGALLKLSAREHVLLLTMHHIVSDGWSMAVLNRELSALYEAYSQGRSSPLRELPIQYADYALWQRQWVQGKVLQEHLQYWKERLMGAPPQLQLPADRPRPATESFKGSLLKFELPEDLTRAMVELAQREGATLFMVCLATYKLLLSRWSGQDDVVVGSSIAGRTQAQTEDLIGFFVNMLALRTDLSGNPSFRQLLGRVKEVTLGAYAHQELPFEKLVEELRPERSLSRQSLVQVTLVLRNFPQDRLELAGLAWTSMSAEHTSTRFDLTMHMYETPQGGMVGLLEYATDLFDAATIERMARQLRTLFEAIVADPDTPILDLPLLTAQERQQLLFDWNSTAADYSEMKCVHQHFSEQAAKAPDATALSQGERRLTYRQLDEQSNQLAHFLIDCGAGPEVIVGLFMERSIELVIGLLGILKAGSAYLPLEPSYPEKRLGYMFEDARSPLLLTRSALANHLPAEHARVIALDLEWPRIAEYPTTPPASEVTLENLAYVIYTSGSTGVPKGVMVEHARLMSYMQWAMRLYAPESGDAIPMSSPLAFDATATGLYCGLLSGRAVVLVPDGEEIETLENLLQQPTRWSLIKVSPAHLQALGPRLSLTRPPCSVNLIVVGGEPLPPATVELWRSIWPQVRIINQYGPTETVVACTAYEIQLDLVASHSVPIGRPAPNVQLYVLDSRRQPVPIGVPGELYIAGSQVSRGYLGKPEMTAERFMPNPFGAPGARMYRTGDLVRYLPDGNAEFIGRADNQVKIRGYRIELGEIESVLGQHPAVNQAVVLAREDVPGDRRLVAYVVGDRKGSANADFTAAPEKLRSESVSEWETVHETTYAASTVIGPSFVGWDSSYTGEPIPEAEMEEWLGCTISRIQSLQPKKILEIGCGVGLLLQHLAPQCAVYVGTDFSASALQHLRHWMTGRPDLAHVQLLHRSATELGDLASGSYDVVVLNSVVQYFPDIEYLVTVLIDVVRLLTPGGKVFLGDIRDLRLLTMFHGAVQLSRAAATVATGQLRRRISRAISQDKELVIDPQFFQALPARLPGIHAAEVQLKRGRASNELTRYRYDVVLHTTKQDDPSIQCEVVDWQASLGSVAELGVAIDERRWPAVLLRSVPNARLTKDAAALSLIETGGEHLEASSVRRQVASTQSSDVEPQDIWELADANGYSAVLSPGDRGGFDVRLLARTRPCQIAHCDPVCVALDAPWSAYANDPLENSFRLQLVPQLREFLRSRLPEYMVPSAWMVLKELPLTRNGKVDRRALPGPEQRPEEMGDYVAPSTELERTLADMWAQLLQVDQVGTRDNFFELGGHSLLIVQLRERLRRLDFAVDVRTIYANPTIAELAGALVAGRASSVTVPPNLIPEGCQAITPQMLTLVALGEAHIQSIVASVPGGAANVQDIYPLASLQEGMLFHHLLGGHGADAYARWILWSLCSPERLNQLLGALQHVIDRHDILRTAVFWKQLPAAVQVVYRSAILPVEELQLSPDRDALDQVHEWAKSEHQRLDLSAAPLMRLQVAKDPNGQQWYALLQTHHFVFDAESMHTMLAEVKACLEGRERELPTPMAYRDHVAQALAHAREHDAATFFRSKLSDVDEPTAPFGLLDVHGSGGGNLSARRALEPRIAARLRALAAQFGVSAATLFHAVWGIVVSRTSGREDVVYGTVLLGRLQGSAGAQRILGVFINTLPLRLQLQGSTAKELIEHTQQELTELFAYEQASLAVAQRCSSIPGSAPLFTSLMSYRHSAVDEEPAFAVGVGISFPISQGATNYPITFSVADRGSSFMLEAETDRRIDPHRLLGYVQAAMQSLLSALENTPDTLASSLSILPEAERREVIQTFNATNSEYPDDQRFPDLFEAQVARTPRVPAISFGTSSLSYSALNEQANRLAWYLRDLGVGPDDIVGLFVERGQEMAVGLIATLKAGGAYLPLDPSYPAERIRYMLQDAAPRIVLTQEKLRAALPQTSARVLSVDREWPTIASYAPDNPPAHEMGSSPRNLAYVIYTSGSTGKPKGVMVEHRGLCNLAAMQLRTFDVKTGDKLLQVASFSFDACTWDWAMAMSAGGTLCLLPREDLLPGEPLRRTLEVQGIAHATLSPAALGAVPATHGLEALRTIVVGGEACSEALVKRWAQGRKFFNAYGPTEATVCATLHECHAAEIGNPLIGRPIANSRTYILDKFSQPVPVGVTGEIYVGGIGVARGYLNRPELTAERFIRDPFSTQPQARMYKTGDLGRWRSDGEIEFLGRADGQVKIRGFRVELGEIEACLLGHPQVRSATVILRKDVPGEKQLVAYLVATESNLPEVERLRAYLSEVLPEYMIPSAFVLLDELPLTPNGKIDRRALPAPDLAAYASSEYEAPQGDTEQALADIWANLLRLERVGRNDDFFALGGHSLVAMQVVARIQTVFSIEIPISALFEFSTVKSLAARLEDLRHADMLHGIADAADAEIDELLDSVAAMAEGEVEKLLQRMHGSG